MTFPLRIATHDRNLGFDFVQSKTLNNGARFPAPGATLEYRGTLVRKAIGIPEILEFVMHLAEDIDVALLAGWLYDKVKGKDVQSITINERVISKISADAIRQALDEAMRVK